MRQEDINRLNKPYEDERADLDRRFHSAIGADVPNASNLAEEIFSDLHPTLFGVAWWVTFLPNHERVLISDYVYQCAVGIEMNLAEAKLHYLEWLHTRDQQNERVADMAHITDAGQLVSKLPPATKPMDDIPHNMEKLHICGLFRAIGSAFDCLGAVIVAVLGLPIHLRYADINSARGLWRSLRMTGRRPLVSRLSLGISSPR